MKLHTHFKIPKIFVDLKIFICLLMYVRMFNIKLPIQFNGKCFLFVEKNNYATVHVMCYEVTSVRMPTEGIKDLELPH